MTHEVAEREHAKQDDDVLVSLLRECGESRVERALLKLQWTGPEIGPFGVAGVDRFV